MATVQNVVEVFLGWCADHRSANTLKQYSTRLKPFAAEFGSRAFASLTPLEIDAFLSRTSRFPDGSLKAPDTRRINAIALEQLQRFAKEKRVIQEKIFDRLEKPAGRERKRLPTEEEIAKILYHSSIQFQLIYRALCQSGARPNELARATFDDWHRERGMIILKKHKTAEKTGEDREIAVGHKMAAILQQATQNRTSGALFLTPRGRVWTSGALTQTFTRIRHRAGLPGDLVLYLARHKHATELCKLRGVHAAKQALGHRNISTTQKYIHPDDKDLKANQDAIGPDPSGEPTSDDSSESDIS